jgi:hypothetical protein
MIHEIPLNAVALTSRTGGFLHAHLQDGPELRGFIDPGNDWNHYVLHRGDPSEGLAPRRHFP